MFRVTNLAFIFLLLSFLSYSQNNAAIKLFRFGQINKERPGVLMPEGKHLDVSAFGEDYNEKFFATGGIARLQKWLVKNKAKCPVVPANSRFASCVARPSKIIAIGLNYAEHVKEGFTSIPSEPIIFMKASTALCGPFDSLIIPKNSNKTDYEAELAVIIGKPTSNVSEQEAMDHIAGYSIMNDYSEREWQLERPGGQWDKGKSANTFAPLGPYLVTPWEIGDPQNLKIWLKVNGTLRQEASTADMIFKVARLVSEISKYMDLLPGDVIATGTPSGVGFGAKPPRFLKPGDVIELGIEKIGTQKQVARAARN